MKSTLFDARMMKQARDAMELMTNVLQASTEYSIIGKDLERGIVLWNEGARRTYGYEADEVVGKINSEILHTPEDVALGRPREIMGIALREGKWEGVIGRIRKDGRRIQARVVITPRLDAAGKPIGFLLISKDVSNELRFSEHIRRVKLFDSAIVGSAREAVYFIANILESSTEYSVIGKDLDGKILLWNEGARRIYGYEPEEVVGRANRDISEQARLQTKLAEQQAYNRSLIEASADALFAIAPDGTVTDVNEEATRLTGYSRKHLVNSRFPDYFTEPERAQAGVEQTLTEGRVLLYELVLITRQGRRIAVSFNAGVFSDAAGEPLGILAGARNITAQKKLEQ